MLLNLNNWRCFENQILSLPESGFLLYDSNGIGKTSILSSIFTLYTTLGFADQSLKNCIRYGQNYFGINDQARSFTAILEPNGRLKTKQEDLAEDWAGDSKNPLILSYSPIDNQLLSLSRSKKLSFIDQILAQLLPSYLSNLKVLNKLLAHKQALIRAVNEEGAELDYTLLNTTNQSIWNFSLYFWEKRSQFLSFLNGEIFTINSKFNLNFGIFNLKYFTTIESVYKTSLGFSEFRVQLAECRNGDFKELVNNLWVKELAAGRCLWGAQRDDFEIFLDDKNVIDILSRGQMRLLVLWLKHLGLKYAKQVLDLDIDVWWLLDDAFNELDNSREQVLVQEILSYVDWYMITSTKNSDICPSFTLADLLKN